MSTIIRSCSLTLPYPFKLLFGHAYTTTPGFLLPTAVPKPVSILCSSILWFSCLLSVLPSLLCPLQFMLAPARSLRRKANNRSEAMSKSNSSTPHCWILLPSTTPELTQSHPCRHLLQTTVVSSQMKARSYLAALSISHQILSDSLMR